MAYQNIFTQVQLRGELEDGVPLPAGNDPRFGPFGFTYWMGKLGGTQIGPVYLGTLGVASLLMGTIAFLIIGFNFWPGQLGPHPVRPPAVLAVARTAAGQIWLEDPAAAGRRWLVADHRLFPHRRRCCSGGHAPIAARSNCSMGTHVAWAFASAIWLYLVLGFIRPLAMGSWAEAVPFGIFPHLDWTAAFSIRYGNSVLQPVPRPLDRLPLWLDAVVRHARRDHPGRRPLWR